MKSFCAMGGVLLAEAAPVSVAGAGAARLFLLDGACDVAQLRAANVGAVLEVDGGAKKV